MTLFLAVNSGIFSLMNWQGMDKRKFPRANYRCLLRVKRESRVDVLETYTENIGVGGICVVVDKELDLFSKVSLEIVLGEDKDPVFCEGKIVWVVKKSPLQSGGIYEYDTGIEFVNLPEKYEHMMTSIIENILER